MTLARGALTLEVDLDPLAIRVRRDHRPLIERLTLFTQGGQGADRLIELTEGVIVTEQLEEPAELARAAVIRASDAGVSLLAPTPSG